MSLEVCTPWATPDQLCCEGDGTTDDCVDGVVALEYVWTDEELILAASNILFARSGYRFGGVCEFTVWPCVDNCHSGNHPCASCCSVDAVLLPSKRVVSVTEVSEDGDILDPSAYRLERGNVVVRLDGERWQRNTFGLPNCSGVETTITYMAGTAPPLVGQMAAAALACELKKSCNGESCELPANVTSFARRGVDVELIDLSEMLKSGATGIPIVDHFLLVYGSQAHAPQMVDPARRPAGYPAL